MERLASLDVLRAVAVLLVLGTHAPIVSRDGSGWLGAPAAVWRLGGWTGVDLFFVLSGFLVSGLLFQEHARYGEIRFGRFFVRRSFRIYPPFWAMIGATIFVVAVFGNGVPAASIWSELLFFQNYGWPLWNHTWSLAVEEHFYVLLPLLMIGLLRLRPRDADPFAPLPWIVLGVAVALLGLRFFSTTLDIHHNTRLFATHLRLDSLFFGVLLAYIYHVRPESFRKLFRGRRILCLVLAVAAFAPPFVMDLNQSPFLYTVGFTLLYLGGGLLVGTAVVDGVPDARIIRWLAALGAYSYSVYLWHMPVYGWLLPGLVKGLGLRLSGPAQFAIYMVASVAVGIGMARLLEGPVLRLRDRWYPTRSRAPSA